MRTKIDLHFLREAEAFALRFACEDCVHWNDTGACTLEYPAEPRRDALAGESLMFCKEFDLGVGVA